MSTRPKVNSGWFQDRLADKGMSQRGFAKLVKMDPAALTYSIHGKRAWKHDELVAFATIVGVPFEEAAHHAGLAIPTGGKGMCNVAGTVDATGELHTGGVDAPRRVPCPPEAPEGIVAARFKTPMTGAELMDGWLVFYADGVKRVPPEAVGRLCIAWLSNRGRALVGIVRRGYERGTHTVHPWTPGAAAYENVALERASPVLWIRTTA